MGGEGWQGVGCLGADSIRFHDWAAGIQRGHGEVKEFSGANMITAPEHFITSKVLSWQSGAPLFLAPGPPVQPESDMRAAARALLVESCMKYWIHTYDAG